MVEAGCTPWYGVLRAAALAGPLSTTVGLTALGPGSVRGSGRPRMHLDRARRPGCAEAWGHAGRVGRREREGDDSAGAAGEDERDGDRGHGRRTAVVAGLDKRLEQPARADCQECGRRRRGPVDEHGAVTLD